ncbi:hypothetical protein K2Z83_15105 [Oscillochloris sp. ZM17-4]|uniref:hypothetical protein n=1 Tax=Oscillochloris sp. ZM17-4 TaxID=2866714 RepID=UPI001C73736A|nr:hypothetical protein [Oscillochloris sp. ZM17-4]MBX0329005.1 hypothetical protein [Oscillochloris sp. ZM17-4]
MSQHERRQPMPAAPTRPPLGMYGYLIGVILIGLGGGLLISATITYPALWGLGLLLLGSLTLAVTAPLWKPR